MKIEFGHTRIVLVFERFVIKFPRVRFIGAFRALVDYARGQTTKVASGRYGNGPLVTVLIYLFCGFTANRREFAYAKRHPPPAKVTPSLYLLLGGIAHVQERGQEIGKNDWRWKVFVFLLRQRGVTNSDLYNVENFSEWRGALCIHDCGSRPTVKQLDAFVLGILDRVNTTPRLADSLSLNLTAQAA